MMSIYLILALAVCFANRNKWGFYEEKFRWTEEEKIGKDQKTIFLTFKVLKSKFHEMLKAR